MKALKFLKNSAGVSMIEVMMAVAVVGGLSLTVAQLMKNTSENTKQNEAKQENVNLKALIQNNLGVPAACFNTFDALITQANLTAMTGTGTVAVPNIKDKVNTIKYASTTNLHPLTITSMVLTNYIAAAGTADLVINSTFRKSTNVTVMVKPLKIPINFNINTTVPATPDLISCSSMAVSGGEWMLLGNAGTVDGTDYLGTSDSSPLNFRVNAIPSGRIDMSGATFFGYRSGLNNVAGTVNTSFGYDALSTASSTGDNTAVGASALKTNAQWGNTAVGHEALMVNTTGGNNTAIGRNAQAQSTIGTYNTCVGALCMNNLTTGTYNVGVGVTALWGHNSGKLQGSNNIGIGYAAGQFMSTGAFNVLVGDSAAKNMTTGTRNVVLGAESGQGLTTESFKLHIESSGSATPLIGGDFLAGSRMVSIDGKLGVGVPNPTHKIQVGVITGTTSTNSPDVLSLGGTYSTTPGSNAKLRLLDAGGSSYYGLGVSPSSLDVMALAGVTFYLNKVGVVKNVHFAQSGNVGIGLLNPSYQLQLSTDSAAKPGTSTWTIASDARLKDIRAPFVRGLADLEGIHPIYFKYKSDNELGLPSDKEYVGIIAQDAKKSVPEAVHKDAKGYFHVNNDSIIWTMFNSIKELYAKLLGLIGSVEKLNLEVKELKAENQKLKVEMKKQNESFEARMKKLEADAEKKK